MNHKDFIGAWFTGFVFFLALLPMAARPAHAQTETVLYNFCSRPDCNDGLHPYSSLTSDGAGNLYGTTNGANIDEGGNVFELSPNSRGGWNETVLYNFCSEGGGDCTDGANPSSRVIFDSAGNLYGTTAFGGARRSGVVFELSPVGESWKETVLYDFCSQGDCADGASPESGLIFDRAGNLYGTTVFGGTTGTGTVFELSPSAGNWTEQVIYEGGYVAGLAMNAAGKIFGAGVYSVFELSPNGNGGWNPTVIHTFSGAPKDGSAAFGTPVLDRAGNLYGTTVYGGAKNYGTVYKLTPGRKGKTTGTWTEKILHSFQGGKHDGSNPDAGIVFDAAGNIYGTTTSGPGFAGTVYELVAAVGKSSYKDKVLWIFNYTDGFSPYDSLILDNAGNLFGTAFSGGDYGGGVVFEVTP